MASKPPPFDDIPFPHTEPPDLLEPDGEIERRQAFASRLYDRVTEEYSALEWPPGWAGSDEYWSAAAAAEATWAEVRTAYLEVDPVVTAGDLAAAGYAMYLAHRAEHRRVTDTPAPPGGPT